MAERGKFETTEKRIRAAYSKLGMVSMVVGLVALLATVVSVVIVLRAEKTEVAAQVLANDELTMYPAVAELKGYFTYADEEVAHLWKVRVKFVNSGDKTVIGTGNQKNILGEGLNFVFPDGTRVLRVEEEIDTFESSIMQTNSNEFQIRFSQWRSGEYNIASFYIASEKSLEAAPCPSVPTRDIIDGDVIIQDLTEREPREPVSITDRLPVPISIAGKIMGGISAGGLTLVFIIILALAWIGTVKKFMWKRQYLSSFRIYLNQVEPKISKSKKRLYRENPEILPDELWANFEGKKASWSMDFDDKPTATIITVLFTFAALGLSFLVLMLFPV